MLDLCFDCARPLFQVSRQKSDLFQLCGRLEIAFRRRNMSRTTALAQSRNKIRVPRPRKHP